MSQTLINGRIGNDCNNTNKTLKSKNTSKADITTLSSLNVFNRGQTKTADSTNAGYRVRTNSMKSSHAARMADLSIRFSISSAQ